MNVKTYFLVENGFRLGRDEFLGEFNLSSGETRKRVGMQSRDLDQSLGYTT